LGKHEDVSTLAAIGDNLVNGMLMEVYRASQQESDFDCTCNGFRHAPFQHGVPKHGPLNKETI
jgi:hypothetical protein